jgi:hypothetical protein
MSRIYLQDKYICTNSTVKKKLNDYGVAIIPNILNEQEINDFNDGIWNYLEYASANLPVPIYKSKPKTWKTYTEYFTEKNMLLQKFGIGHSSHLWNLRQNPKVIDVFASIYNTNELAVSFDGCSFHLPVKKTQYSSKWFHTDQSYSTNDFQCVQSWITGYPINDTDATLGFLEKSHMYHEACSKNFNLEVEDIYYYEDYYELNSKQIEFYKNLGCTEYYIKCPAGSMVLWDSRTIHYGANPQPKHNTSSNFRNVAYISTQPKKLISKQVQKQRANAFVNGKTTSHWTTKCTIFQDYPRNLIHLKDLIPKPEKPILTELGKSLI